MRAEARSLGLSSYSSSKKSALSTEHKKVRGKATKTDEILQTKFNTFLEQD